ncbi:MAG: hypothetical protein FWD66_01155 [Paludibacter sp.]|nr:hypothetical protein [Paludibacter sp.]
MIINKDKAYKSLHKKGFIDSDIHSIDHKYLEYYSEGKLVCYTKVSHGSNKDLDDYLIRQMSQQCKLTKQQFSDLVKCPLSKEQYKEILKEQNLLD